MPSILYYNFDKFFCSRSLSDSSRSREERAWSSFTTATFHRLGFHLISDHHLSICVSIHYACNFVIYRIIYIWKFRFHYFSYAKISWVTILIFILYLLSFGAKSKLRREWCFDSEYCLVCFLQCSFKWCYSFAQAYLGWYL